MNESHKQPLVQPVKGVRRIDLIVPMAALFVSFVSIILTWRSVAVEERMAGQMSPGSGEFTAPSQ